MEKLMEFETITKKEAVAIVRDSRHCFKVDGCYSDNENISINLSDGTNIFIDSNEEYQGFDVRKIISLEYIGDVKLKYSK